MSERFLIAFKLFFPKHQWDCVLKFCHLMSFYDLQVLLENIYDAISDTPDELFWATLNEKFFEFVRKWMEHLKSGEILCAHRPKFLNVSADAG